MAIQLTLMVIEFGFAGRPKTQIYYKDKLTLGRDYANDIPLNRPEVSSLHAEISVKRNSPDGEPALYIKDMNSSNGTLVGEKALEPCVETSVSPNQRIIIGNFLIKAAFVDIDVPETEEKAAPAEEPTPGEPEEAAVGMIETPPELKADELPAAIDANEFEENDMSKLYAEAADGLGDQDAEIAISWANISADEPVPAPADEPAEEQESSALEAQEEQESSSSDYSFGLVPETIAAEVLEPPARAPLSFTAAGDDVVTIDFEALELFSVRGEVQHRGQPLSGIRIHCNGAEQTTSDSGTFEFAELEEGTEYELRAENDDYLFEASEPRGSLTSDVHCVFTAKKLFTVSGLAMHRDNPLPGVRIKDRDGNERLTDESGRVEFGRICEGSPYELSAEHNDYIFESEHTAGMIDNEHVAISFRARKLITITGRVMHKGAPLAEVQVDGGVLGQTTTGEDGVYRFERVPEGTDFKITLHKPGYSLGRK